MIFRAKRVAAVLCLLAIVVAPAWASGDYGNAADVATVRKAVDSIVIHGRGYTCTVHANRVAVIGAYAYVDVFERDPCGAGAEDLWAKRNGSWVRALLGKPMVLPCTMSSIGVPLDVISQLYMHLDGTTAAQVQRDMKPCLQSR